MNPFISLVHPLLVAGPAVPLSGCPDLVGKGLRLSGFGRSLMLLAVLAQVWTGMALAQTPIPAETDLTVALAGQLQVSQTTSPSPTSHPATAAVDASNGTSSQTDSTTPDNGWTLDLGGQYYLDHVEVTNVTGVEAAQLSGQTLRLYDAQGRSVYQEQVTDPGAGAKVTLWLPPGVKASKLRIGLENGVSNAAGNKAVTLAEVKVFGGEEEIARTMDIAPLGTATQSTSYNGSYPASNAQDRNKTTFAHTDLNTPGNWWRLDFPAARAMTAVQVVNRHDGWEARLAGLTLKVLDNQGTVLHSEVLANPGRGSALEVVLPHNTVAKTVWIGLENGASNGEGNKVVTLSEVRVYAPLSDPLADTDGDGMNDGTEVAHGTSVTGSDFFGDVDFNGLSNGFEAWQDAHPGNPGLEGLAGALSWQYWGDLGGNALTALTSHAGYPGQPLRRGIMPAAAGVGNLVGIHYADSYGERLRGTLVAPVTGTYYFWIAGDDDVQLWLGTSASRFSKRKVAWIEGSFADPGQWSKVATQRSAGIDLQAGQEYYLEVLHKEGGGRDHVAVAWEYPGQGLQEIPAARLKTLVSEAQDINDNNLPDAWEAQYGLGTLGNGQGAETADPDSDGRSNLDEYQQGCHPMLVDGSAGRMRQERWTSLSGQTVVSLTQSAKFLGTPDQVADIPGIEPPANQAEYYGERLRGLLRPTVTGWHSFWIAADDNAELWLSTTDRKFRKRRIAHLSGSGIFTAFRVWDTYRNQQSEPVYLVAGQDYHLEILHKEGDGGDHVSVAWSVGGGAREVIPAARLTSYARDAEDADDDYLPDGWETQHGLSPADNGRVQPAHGEFGDPDGDGLINQEEYQRGTHPLKADTDGDSYSDSDELFVYGTNPLVADLGIAASPAADVSGMAVASSSGDHFYSLGGTSGFSTSRRGWVEYQFSVPAAGVWLFELNGRARGAAGISELPLTISIDGLEVGSATLRSVSGSPGTVRLLTPWLAAGTHTARIFNGNTLATQSLQVESVKLYATMGPDANDNGVPDWIEDRLSGDNQLVQAEQTSAVSPAQIEGRARFPLAVQVAGPSGAVPVSDSHTRGWYADVPLNPDGSATPVEVTFENGAAGLEHGMTWTATNALTQGAVTLRKGDSLRLASHPAAGADVGSTASLDFGNGEGVNLAPGAASVRTFPQAGTFTVTARYTPGGGTEQTANLTVTVVQADFGTEFALYMAQPRTWITPGVPASLWIDQDPAVVLQPLAPVNGARAFEAEVLQTGLRRVLGRLGQGGPIVSRGSVRGLVVASATPTQTGDTEVVHTYEDGDRIVRMSVVIDHLPAGGYVKLAVFVAGVTFTDGTTTKLLHASDFDENGVAQVYFNYPAGQPTSVCHRLYLYDANDRLIGER